MDVERPPADAFGLVQIDAAQVQLFVELASAPDLDPDAVLPTDKVFNLGSQAYAASAKFSA